MPNFNWDVIQKMGKTKAVKLFKKVYPNLDFAKIYDEKFPPISKSDEEE